MTRQATVLLSSLGFLTLAASSAAWAQFGDVIYFDMLASGLAGCFF